MLQSFDVVVLFDVRLGEGTELFVISIVVGGGGLVPGCREAIIMIVVQVTTACTVDRVEDLIDVLCDITG